MRNISSSMHTSESRDKRLSLGRRAVETVTLPIPITLFQLFLCRSFTRRLCTSTCFAIRDYFWQGGCANVCPPPSLHFLFFFSGNRLCIVCAQMCTLFRCLCTVSSSLSRIEGRRHVALAVCEKDCTMVQIVKIFE